MDTQTIQITKFDRERLDNCLFLAEEDPKERNHASRLERELGRAQVISESKDIPDDVVTMNSIVRLLDLETKREQVVNLCFPADSNAEEGRVSVLAPLGAAILGTRVGDIITLKVPKGERRLRVEEIIYQPEAAGHFSL